jgi:beta-barrel assembly-enhancing protease
MKGLNATSLTAALCCELLILDLVACGHRSGLPQALRAPQPFQSLQENLKNSYLELFEIAPRLDYTDTEFEDMKRYLKEGQDYCTGRFEEIAKTYQHKVDDAQQELKNPDVTERHRHELHCAIQENRELKSQADVIAQHAIPVAYSNKSAKLQLIQEWPAQEKALKQSIADGSYKNRRWGNVQDIGFREIERDQKDDIKAGQDAIRDLKRAELMPKEIDDDVVAPYVNRVAQKIAKNSDLQIPLHLTVLNTREINAFALPGGFVFIERGLLEAADDESELAGVLAHEMSHDIARHAHKLMTKATIASLLYQAAQISAIVLTGGVAGIGAYYAIRYGFYGLGLTLNLTLLGVSGEYEAEADQLGLQYAWKSGYDPSGFIRFFDKMATKEGYVNGVSWFRSHPPFYDRMLQAQKEIAYLPKLENLIVNTSDFEHMKHALKSITSKAEKEEVKDRPSLIAAEKGCPAPSKLGYEPDKPIESICSSPQIITAQNEHEK